MSAVVLAAEFTQRIQTHHLRVGKLDHWYQKGTELSLPFLGTQFSGVAVQTVGRIVAAGYGRQRNETDQTYHWFLVRFTLKQSRIVPQEPL